ncbi:copper amine oxidase N-terminal domain-containing protein [Anaerotignum sp.]
MTIKKLTVIAVAGAALLAGAIGISMRLTSLNEIEMEVPETPVAQETENTDGSQILADMENIPLYYDETEKLMLPLRNVMEGLGGSVVWNKETKMTEVTYRGRTLEVVSGERDAVLNGYEVTLPDAVKMINGCLYADAELISAYYTGEVDFNIDTRQVTLQTKDSAVPVIAVKEIMADAAEGVYHIDVPVIIGLNDSKFEKSLNDSLMQEMQAYADAIMAENGTVQLELKTGMCTKDFLSLWWEGTKDMAPVKFAKNIDLLSQKTVTLADMVSESSLEKVKLAAGEGWTEDRFCLTAEGGLVILKGSNEVSQNMYYWTTEGEQPEWKDAYQALFRK